MEPTPPRAARAAASTLLPKAEEAERLEGSDEWTSVLAAERLREALAFLDFAAGELPQDPARPLSDKAA